MTETWLATLELAVAAAGLAYYWGAARVKRPVVRRATGLCITAVILHVVNLPWLSALSGGRMHWAAIIFGWPAASTAIGASAAGLLLRWPVLVLIGALVGLPFMYYLFATPRFWMFAALASLCHFAAVAAVARRPPLAGALFLPTPLLTWWVAAMITRG